MSDEPAPARIAVTWSLEARADVRVVDRLTAMQIFHCIDRYLASRTGDVQKLKPPRTGFRLRCGDYRVFFDLKGEDAIEITGVRNAARRTAEPSARSAPRDIVKVVSLFPASLLRCLPQGHGLKTE